MLRYSQPFGSYPNEQRRPDPPVSVLFNGQGSMSVCLTFAVSLTSSLETTMLTKCVLNIILFRRKSFLKEICINSILCRYFIEQIANLMNVITEKIYNLNRLGHCYYECHSL